MEGEAEQVMHLLVLVPRFSLSLDKLTVVSFMKKYISFYVICNSITVFTKPQH